MQWLAWIDVGLTRLDVLALKSVPATAAPLLESCLAVFECFAKRHASFKSSVSPGALQSCTAQCRSSADKRTNTFYSLSITYMQRLFLVYISGPNQSQSGSKEKIGTIVLASEVPVPISP